MAVYRELHKGKGVLKYHKKHRDVIKKDPDVVAKNDVIIKYKYNRNGKVIDKDISHSANTRDGQLASEMSYNKDGFTGTLKKGKGWKYDTDYDYKNITVEDEKRITDTDYNRVKIDYKYDRDGHLEDKEISYTADTRDGQLPSRKRYSENGYEGTLYKGKGELYKEREDKDRMWVVTGRRTEKEIERNIVSIYYNKYGRRIKTRYSNNCPRTMEYDRRGYEGTLRKGRTWEYKSRRTIRNRDGSYIKKQYWKAEYKGTVVRRERQNLLDWQKKYYRVDYTGTVTKDIRKRVVDKEIQRYRVKYIGEVSKSVIDKETKKYEVEYTGMVSKDVVDKEIRKYEVDYTGEVSKVVADTEVREYEALYEGEVFKNLMVSKKEVWEAKYGGDISKEVDTKVSDWYSNYTGKLNAIKKETQNWSADYNGVVKKEENQVLIDSRYIAELGNYTLRWYQDGGQVEFIDKYDESEMSMDIELDKNNSIGIGDRGNDRITGTSKTNEIYGLGGDDKLYGKVGNDKILGGSGSDELYGGTGNDMLYGGTGSDTYIFEGDFGKDNIYEENNGEGNIIKFKDVNFDEIQIDRLNDNDFRLTVKDKEGNLTDNSVTIRNKSGINIRKYNFEFADKTFNLSKFFKGFNNGLSKKDNIEKSFDKKIYDIEKLSNKSNLLDFETENRNKIVNKASDKTSLNLENLNSNSEYKIDEVKISRSLSLEKDYDKLIEESDIEKYNRNFHNDIKKSKEVYNLNDNSEIGNDKGITYSKNVNHKVDSLVDAMAGFIDNAGVSGKQFIEKNIEEALQTITVGHYQAV